tara:strand:- start:23 stop:724 length:702 start_codon:yes stop_codon:yes gene_type:complete
MWKKLSTQAKITTISKLSIASGNFRSNKAAGFSRASLLSCFGFSLVEILVGTLITVIVLSALYFFFVTGARQANSGSAKLKSFHRLRIVMETLKDDIREAVEFDKPELNGGPSSVLEFQKFITSLENEGGNEGVGPRTRKVSYSFDKKDKRLRGLYADDVELINTQLFENVEFERYSMGDRIFIRLHFLVKRDDKNTQNLVSIYQTVGPKHINTKRSQKFWYSLPETIPKREI